MVSIRYHFFIDKFILLFQHVVVRASAMLRLYTALRGIAGLKLSEDEVACLLEMITCKPPVTSAGVKFASLGLSVLIACNSLIGSPENEKVNVLKNKVHS